MTEFIARPLFNYIGLQCMPQKQAWEKEYQNPKFVTNSNEPQLDFKHFVKWLRKDQNVSLEHLSVLDLGSGTGKNSIFLAERGSAVTGIELSTTALNLAKERSRNTDVKIKWITGSIGSKLPVHDTSVDLALDVVSSNSLSQAEREVYIAELTRVLKPGGYVYVKALCLDGDKNAEQLLKKFPGKEKNTYVMPETGITERVFTKQEIQDLYKDFSTLKLERKSSYTLFAGKSYKRNFWLVYLQK